MHFKEEFKEKLLMEEIKVFFINLKLLSMKNLKNSEV
jgi:hypothetical protein